MARVYCPDCSGSGNLEYESHAPGKGPDSSLMCEPCHACAGTGEALCCECREPATDMWIERVGDATGTYPLCERHMREYAESARERAE